MHLIEMPPTSMWLNIDQKCLWPVHLGFPESPYHLWGTGSMEYTATYSIN